MLRAERHIKKEEGITSLLAGDLFLDFPIGCHFLIFKFYYYALLILGFRNLRSLRKRKFDLPGELNSPRPKKLISICDGLFIKMNLMTVLG